MSFVVAPRARQVLALIALTALNTCGCQPRAPAPGPPADFESPSRIAAGRSLFLEHCALCHGERADGLGPRRQNFDRPPRDFTSRAWRETATPTSVFQAIRDGVDRTAMPSWTSFSDDQRWALTAYVLSVATSRENADAM